MFSSTHTRRFEAITAVIDLEGFTPFTVQPDMHVQLARFLNFLFQEVDDSLQTTTASRAWLHRKFLGDGALYIWPLPENDRKQACTAIVLSLYNLFRTYPTNIVDQLENLNLRGVPKRIRVGIACGEVTELCTDSGAFEYVGFSINLAARLQSYCSEIGFLISCSVPLDVERLQDYALVRAQAKSIKGMTDVAEEVRYVKQDAARMGRRELAKFFRL